MLYRTNDINLLQSIYKIFRKCVGSTQTSHVHLPTLYCYLLWRQFPDVQNILFLRVFICRLYSYFLIKAHNSIIMRVQISVVETSAAF